MKDVKSMKDSPAPTPSAPPDLPSARVQDCLIGLARETTVLYTCFAEVADRIGYAKESLEEAVRHCAEENCLCPIGMAEALRTLIKSESMLMQIVEVREP
jgi:hypothetical protein